MSRQKASEDWFGLALLSEGSQLDFLDSIADDLQLKLELVRCLRSKFFSNSKDSRTKTETLHTLKTTLKNLEKSLDFRFTWLKHDKFASWQRPLIGEKFGPFSSSLFTEAVLGSYSPEKWQVYVQRINYAWENHIDESLIFDDSQKTLWHIVLELNVKLYDLVHLNFGGQEYKITQIADALPDNLKSNGLIFFLNSLAVETTKQREVLSTHFHKLMQECIKMWSIHAKEELKNKQHHSYHDTAERVRAELRERRQAGRAKAFLSAKELMALKFFGFDDLPELEGLKLRYRELARQYHPDINSGKDESFKMLTLSYEALSKRLRPPV